MLTEWFVDHALEVVEGITDLLPEFTLEVGDVSTALSWVLTFDGVLPVHEALLVLTQCLLVAVVLVSYRVIKTLIAHIPWIGGSG
jgi:hypothetical protein